MNLVSPKARVSQIIFNSVNLLTIFSSSSLATDFDLAFLLFWKDFVISVSEMKSGCVTKMSISLLALSPV
jgi:hypothetical protein